MKPYLSVIVPAYNQGKNVYGFLKSLDKVLRQLKITYEVVCVNDGSLDKTYQNAKKASSKTIKVFGYTPNRGKGNAVRYGISKSKGKLIAFVDVGDINPAMLTMYLEHFKWYDADIIIGSKRHPASKVNYPRSRRIFSFGYQMGVKILFGLRITDSQVGMKLFKREVLEKVMPRLLVKRYAFDIETLVVAHYLGYKKIYEAPVEIHYNFKDIVHASGIKSILNMLWDTLGVFYRLKILRYYDDANKKNWQPNMYLEW